MYSHGVGQIQLVRILQGIHGLPIVKPHIQNILPPIYAGKNTNIAIKHPGTAVAVFLKPGHIIVVFDLHDPVALPQRATHRHQLRLMLVRRVQRRLQLGI